MCSALRSSTIRALSLLAAIALWSLSADAQARPLPSPAFSIEGGASPVEPGSPPDPDGYFTLLPVGSWSSLPSGRVCRTLVHDSSWEPRPENAAYNATVPDEADVDASFALRPRSDDWINWSSWLLPRVDGDFTGTTDEIFQWGACKWGLPDNLIRAITAAESTWYQYLTYPGGRCVPSRGCGDLDNSDLTYCRGIGRFGYDYQKDYGAGVCPGTFSIAGVMSYQDPDWGKWPGDQNGTFPFNRDSTAFGWEQWLVHSYPSYGAGDIWGCAGVWYSGAWHTAAAETYIATVRDLEKSRIWLEPFWMVPQYQCDPRYGCPG